MSSLLNSEAAWTFNGISLNINGLNHPPLSLYETLLSKYQLVAFQETKFVKHDSLQTNDHFIHTAGLARAVFGRILHPQFTINAMVSDLSSLPRLHLRTFKT